MRDSELRRAAVLIAGLGVAEADALLARLPEATAAALRGAVMELDDVGGDEEAEIVAEFLAGASGPPPKEAADDELVLSHADQAPDAAARVEEIRDADGPSPSRPSAAGDGWRRRQLAWAQEALAVAEPRELAKLLSLEHPQSAAVVLSTLDEEHAEAVLAVAPDSLQSTWRQRLCDLVDLDGDMIADVMIAAASQLGPGRREESDAPPPLRTEPAATAPVAARPPSAARSFNDSHAAAWEWQDLESADLESIAALLSQVDEAAIVLALLGATTAGCRRILSATPRRAAGVERRMRKVRTFSLADVRRAQQLLLDVAGRLAREGRIAEPAAPRVSFAA